MMNVCIRNQHEKVTHDKDGNITIVDRIKDMIKVRNFLTGWGILIFLVQVKGLQVSPTELEEVLAKVVIISHELELG